MKPDPIEYSITTRYNSYAAYGDAWEWSVDFVDICDSHIAHGKASTREIAEERAEAAAQVDARRRRRQAANPDKTYKVLV